MPEPRTVTVYIDYKSPYAYLAKDSAYELARDFPVRLDWLPYRLDIPSFFGSARLNASGRIFAENHNAPQQQHVKKSCIECRMQTSQTRPRKPRTQKIREFLPHAKRVVPSLTQG